MGYEITIDTDDHTELDHIVVPDDTIVKIEGFPFVLKAGSAIQGRKENFDAAMISKQEKPVDVFIEARIYKDGEPCDHKGCASHITHPCECCGRTGARGEIWRTNMDGRMIRMSENISEVDDGKE